MEIQMTGCEDGNYAVYLLRQYGQVLTGLPIGEIRIGNGAGKTVLVFSAEEIGGSRFGLEDMQGIYLTAGKNSFAASQWEDGELAWESFQIYKERDRSEVPTDGAEGEATDAGAEGETADAGAKGKASNVGVEEVHAKDYEKKESATDGICEEKAEGSERKRMAKIADADKGEAAGDISGFRVAVALAENGSIETMLTDTSDNGEEKEDLTEAELAAQPEIQATQTAVAIDISPYMTA